MEESAKKQTALLPASLILLAGALPLFAGPNLKEPGLVVPRIELGTTLNAPAAVMGGGAGRITTIATPLPSGDVNATAAVQGIPRAPGLAPSSVLPEKNAGVLGAAQPEAGNADDLVSAGRIQFDQAVHNRSPLATASPTRPASNHPSGLRPLRSDTSRPYPFRDMVIANHFVPENAARKTIGIEVEAGGISANQAVQILLEELGGSYLGKQKVGDTKSHYIANTIIGTIRIDGYLLGPLVNHLFQNKLRRFSNFKGLSSLIDWVDRLGTIEIVTQPLSYEQVKIFGRALDRLGLEGAKGTTFYRLVSTQVNVGIDADDPIFMKNLLANYYRNHAHIRQDTKPGVGRGIYIRPISPEFMAKLDDPSWKPSIQELFDWYQRYSPHKLSSLQLLYAFLTNKENYDKFPQPGFRAPYPARPIAEFREANTILSTPQDPVRASRLLMREVDFAIAMVDAAKDSAGMTYSDQQERALKIIDLDSSPSRAPPDGRQGLRDILAPKYFVPLRTKRVPRGEVAIANPDILRHWDIAGRPEDVNEQIISRYSIETDPNASAEFNEPNSPYATAHSDGFGGIGDGRSFNIDDKNGHVLNAKGIGLTPYILKHIALFLGWHTGGVDGKASLAEGLRTYIVGEIFHRLGIVSERLAALIDNKETSSHGEVSEPSAIILRDLPGGAIRNSHLRIWDPIQIRKALEYLKEIVSAETKTRYTDSMLVVRDAHKTAQLAARMQDSQVVHGALTAGNTLVYPGLVDLNTVEFMPVPDPDYTSLGQLGRFGRQALRLRELLLERQTAYAKANPTLSGIKAARIFDQAYEKELALLSLQRLGLERSLAERIYGENPVLASEYARKLWTVKFGRLHSDIRTFESLIAANFEQAQAKPLETALRLSAQVTNPHRLIPASRRPWLQSLRHWRHGRLSGMTQDEAVDLLSKGVDLLKLAIKNGQSPDDSVATTRFIRVAQESALARAEQQLPSKIEVEDLIKKMISAKERGAPLAPMISQAALMASGAKAPASATLRHTHAAHFAGDLVNPDNILSRIKSLAGEVPLFGQFRLTDRYFLHNKVLARGYIIEELRKMGYAAHEEHEEDPTFSVDNVVAEVKGRVKPNEVIEIMAHYDTAGPFVPGADDNGSGVSAALEIARVMKTLSPSRTVRIILSDMEEGGLLGSEAHVRKLVAGGETLIAALSIDMIGHHPKSPKPLMDMVIGMRPENKVIANVFLGQELSYTGRKVRIFPITLGSNPWVSDHGPYWARRLPALFVRQNYEHFSRAYHSPQDTSETVNPEYVAEVTRMLAEGIAQLAGAEIPAKLIPTFFEKLPNYEAHYQPQAPGTDFVRKSHPWLRLLGRLGRLDKAHEFQVLRHRLRQVIDELKELYRIYKNRHP